MHADSSIVCALNCVIRVHPMSSEQYEDIERDAFILNHKALAKGDTISGGDPARQALGPLQKIYYDHSCKLFSKNKYLNSYLRTPDCVIEYDLGPVKEYVYDLGNSVDYDDILPIDLIGR